MSLSTDENLQTVARLVSDFATKLENIEKKAEENEKKAEEREKKTNEFITGLTSDLRRQTEETIQRYTEDTMASVGELQTAILSLTEERLQTIPAVGTTTSPVVKEASAVVGTENPNEPDRPAVFHQFARPSFMLKQRDLSPDPVAGMGAIPVATGTVMVKQERVPTEMEVMHATLKGLKVGIDNQTKFFAKTDQWKNLPAFFTDYVRRLLVENEHRHGRNAALTEHGVMKLHDDAFILIFVAYVRVHYMGTRRGFTETIVNSVPKLKAEGPNPERPMTIEDYDKRFHAVVNKQLDTLEKIMELAYLGATLAEVKEWPGAGWGKGDMYGVNRILMDCFDPYKDNFLNQIGMENLKTMKTAEEFFAALKKANNSNANRAARLRAEAAEIAPMVKLGEIVASVDDRRKRNPNVLMTRDGPRDVRLPMTPAVPARTPYPGNGFSRSSAPDLSRRSNHPAESGRYRPNTTFGRAAVMEYEEDFFEDDLNCTNPLYDEGVEEMRKQSTAFPDIDGSGWEWGDPDEDEIPDALDVINATRPPFSPGVQRSLYDPKAKPRDSSKPCFKYWLDKSSCPGNCGWDHGPAAMQQLTRDRLKQFTNSWAVPPELLRRELSLMEQSKSVPRNAALSGTGDSGPDSGNPGSRFPSSGSSPVRSEPGPPRVRDSSQPIPGFTESS